ncbi:hypothetical protein, partial [Thiolapillus sp.]|uniref:hypothetical protein n=1 Tax=Thiolapillus sp. TaxID=2017437 RepID=UPI003AF905DB
PPANGGSGGGIGGRWIDEPPRVGGIGLEVVAALAGGQGRSQVCLRPRDRFWDIPVPKIDSAFDNLLVPQPSWSPSTTQQL